MKKLFIFLTFILFIIFQFNCSKQANNSKTQDAAKSNNVNNLSAEEQQQGWVLLFDGKNMDKWRNYGKDSLVGWKVEDGNLVALGQGSNDIISRDQFENFELQLEWKISPQGNSGIFFNVFEGKHPALYETGPEYQLIDEAGWPDKLEDWQKAAANYAMHPASANKQLKPVGEYNLSKIIVNKGHVEHWLNGLKVVEYDLWTPEWEKLKKEGKWKDFPDYGSAKIGHLGLQDHGKVTYFRNIKVRKI